MTFPYESLMYRARLSFKERHDLFGSAGPHKSSGGLRKHAPRPFDHSLVWVAQRSL